MDSLSFCRDRNSSWEFTQIAVLYAKPGQMEMDDIWSNKPTESTAPGFFKFLNSIANKIDLSTWQGYRGNLRFDCDSRILHLINILP